MIIQPMSDYLTDIFIEWLYPMLLGGGFVILLALGLEFISAVMAFVFVVAYAVQKVCVILNLSSLSNGFLMIVATFISIYVSFNYFFRLHDKLSQNS